MPVIHFNGISKRFGDNVVIREFEAEVPDQEFLVLLGPSGCGKSTMLRMIAGLTDITSGELRLDGELVNEKTPKQRNVAFVFQSYALYPHMSVRANIAFPLVMDRFRWWHHIPFVNGFVKRAIMRDPQVAAKVAEVAEMLELTDYLDRRPRALSGGQRQRVAVARALVREPSIYLLDEPLSNLDAKLRTQMRAEISALYQRVGKSFVYVTHDQVEAMTMGTKIIVLNGGVVQQYGTPKEIYDRPANTFVARFIGSPAMNLIPAEAAAGTVRVESGGALELPASDPDRAPQDGALTLGVRAEKVRIRPASEGGPGLEGHVTMVEHLGAETIVGFKFGPAAASGEVGAAASRDLHYARIPGDVVFDFNEPCRIELDLTGASWFDPESGERITGAPVPA
ncbi:ABC transporter ATP-binding protein [Allonocardiopsis opalescens]|uniref:Multiple sugar transport system ATP-binding protein n=1 Tax=Allonocardiopsis opalescens TaxID=1144618 RepID=A0A2T0QA92_9ACTN|nr:ABC transporter ATP-binding protein [Allonocardiopsis opalescens]PRY00808.1 multiple sugar transport system ATP-binding protein [Allonocardiopsis opalescens]